MRRRLFGLSAALVVAAAVALAVSGSALAGWYSFDVDDDSFFDVHFTGASGTVIAKPAYGGWMHIDVRGDGCCGDAREDWELVLRNWTGQVIYDGPCVSVNGSSDFHRLGSNIRMHGARVYTFEFRDCTPSVTGDNHLDEIRITSTSRTWTVLDVFGGQ